jgi:hypothetical protein
MDQPLHWSRGNGAFVPTSDKEVGRKFSGVWGDGPRTFILCLFYFPKALRGEVKARPVRQ